MRILTIFFTLVFISSVLVYPAEADGKKTPAPKDPVYIHMDNKVLPRDYHVSDPVIPVIPAIFTSDSVSWEPAGEGTKRKVYFSDRLTMVLLKIDRPVKLREEIVSHYHVHDQVTYLLEGRLRVMVGDETKEIGTGGCYVVPSNIHHGIVTLTSKVVIMDVFTPAREDFRVK